MKGAALPRIRIYAATAGAIVLSVAALGPDVAAETPQPRTPLVLRAATGHVTNYAEAKIPPFVLPDPLVTARGERVQSQETWMKERRPELLRIYQEEVFGFVPANAPRPTYEVAGDDEPVADGRGRRRHVRLRFSTGAKTVLADLALVLPAETTAPVPVLFQLVFAVGLNAPETRERSAAAREIGPLDEVLRRGYAYATLRYTDVQPDDKATRAHGVQALAHAEDSGRAAGNEWGTIATWAWAASRVLDYLATLREVDARRVALIGHSRLGKTVLWASAMDPRFALVFSSCSGEMGAALSRRDFGETIDDLAGNLPWQFARNFQRYAGRWNALPVDAHCLIALSAPRPVFLTGGTEDQWADPKGQFLAAVAAEPVYRLFRKTGVGQENMPPLDVPLMRGQIGWLYHTGGHSITLADWRAFLDFADRHLMPSSN